MFRKRWGIVVAALCLKLFSFTSFAQGQSENAIGGAQKNVTALEEVIVYARRRQELLQQTPVAVSAFT